MTEGIKRRICSRIDAGLLLRSKEFGIHTHRKLSAVIEMALESFFESEQNKEGTVYDG